MSATLKFGAGAWAAKEGSVLAYNDENNNFKPLPFTFTRASSATRVNESGLIESVASGVPRIDFLDNADGHLLLEPSRTNVFTDSEDISTWTNSGALTRTYNIAVAPDGQTTADGIQDETGVSFKNVYKQFSVSGNPTMTGSVFVKKVASETNYMGVVLLFSGVTSKVAYGIINTVTGTIVAADSTITPTFKVEDYGDYWRFAITATDNGSNTLCRFGVYACLSTNGTSIGVGVSSLRTIWGAQLEAGSYATSYIPTSGSSVTRVADTSVQIPPSGIIGQTEGTLFLEFPDVEDTLAYISIDASNSTSNRMIIYGAADGVVRAQIREAGVVKLSGSSSTINGVTKAAIAFNSSGSVFYVNGTQISTGSSATYTGLNVFNLNHANQIGAKISDAKIYNTRLSNSELAALTSL